MSIPQNIIADVLRSLGASFRFNTRIKGKSGVYHEVKVLFWLPGDKVKYALFSYHTIEVPNIMEVLIFHYDTGIRPVILCKHSTEPAFTYAKSVEIPIIPYRGPHRLVSDMRKLVYEMTR